MKQVFLLFLFTFLIYSQSNSDLSLQKFNEKVFEIDYNSVESYQINNLVINKPGLNLKIKNGVISLLRDRHKKTRFAYFKGEAYLSYSPLSELEKKHLNKFFENEKLESLVENFIFIFSNDFYSQISKANPSEIISLKDLKWDFNLMFKSFRPNNFHKLFLDKNVSSSLIWMDTDEFGELYYMEDPTETEEISLMVPNKWTSSWKGYEIVNSYHKKNDYQYLIPDTMQKLYSYNVLRYDINTEFEAGVDIKGSTKLKLTSNYNKQSAIYLYLYHRLNVTNVNTTNGDLLRFYRADKRGHLLIKLNKEICKNDTLTININYKGEIFNLYLDRKANNYYGLRSSMFWYPNLGRTSKAFYKSRYKYPKDFEVLSVGKKISEESKDDFIIAKWQTDKPLNMFTITYGKFEKFSIQKDNLPKVTVYGKFDKSNMKNELAPEIVNSMNFFSNIYGKLDIDDLHITEIPYFHGQAFEGFIHLSILGYIHGQNRSYLESFRAHEVAHQWWGHGITEKTYHDAWLEEGFAEYSGMWYAQLATNDSERFNKMLRDYRDEIISNRKSPLFADGVESSAIYMGRRAGSTETAGDYGLIIYKKGAYVLHMLRMMMMNIQSLSDDKFIAMMKDFYQNYKGKKAATIDFQRIVEKHGGMRMDWFFNQWVYGSATPKFKYAWKYEKKADGKYQLKIKIRQDDVPENFQTVIPIAVIFDDDKYYRTKLLLNQRQVELTLPPLPMEPEDLKFNIFEAVLCDYDEEDWDDF